MFNNDTRGRSPQGRSSRSASETGEACTSRSGFRDVPTKYRRFKSEIHLLRHEAVEKGARPASAVTPADGSAGRLAPGTIGFPPCPRNRPPKRPGTEPEGVCTRLLNSASRPAAPARPHNTITKSRVKNSFRLPIAGCRLPGENSEFRIPNWLGTGFLLPGRTQLSLTGQLAYVPQTLAGQLVSGPTP